MTSETGGPLAEVAVVGHVLVVGPCEECSILEDVNCERERNGRHSWTTTVECPGVTLDCLTYWTCDGGHPMPDGEEADDADDAEVACTAHDDREHIYGGDGWAVAGVPGQCIVANAHNLPDAVADLDISRPGRYPVGHDMDDWTDLVLTLSSE